MSTQTPNGAPCQGRRIGITPHQTHIRKGNSVNSLTQTPDSNQFDLLALLDDSPQGRFERFHDANPAVYTALVRLAREWRSRHGQRRLGMSLLIGQVRWEMAMATGGDDFKINNNFAGFYSRLIMKREFDLADAFDTRTSAADSWIKDAA